MEKRVQNTAIKHSLTAIIYKLNYNPFRCWGAHYVLQDPQAGCGEVIHPCYPTDAFDISFSAHYTLLLAFLHDFLNKSLEAVKFLIDELSEVSKKRHLTVKILSADFAAASKNSGKIFAAF